MNKNILMLCYYYPPITDVGSKRSIAFSKYLKKHGWNPYVLSVKNPDRAFCSVGKDSPPQGIHTEYSYSIINLSKLVRRLNGALSRILKLFKINVKHNYFYDFFCIPDHFWGWIPLTTIKAARLIKKFKIDLIYVSCTPWSSAITGALLKLITGKPLVLDFRDPFAIESIFTRFEVSNSRKAIERFIQRQYLRFVDIMITTTEESRQEYIQQYPLVKDKIFTVHNGFDAEFLPLSSAEKTKKYKKFTIAYTGEFYFYAINSKIFFEALALLKSQGEINRNNFQFLFYGEDKNEIRRIAEEFKIEDLVLVSSRIPYKDTLTVLSKSHLLLLRIVKLMISTKLFEGISLNIPFLATIPSGEAEDIIKKYSPSSYIVTEESAEKVADSILDAMSKYKHNRIQNNHIREFLDNFSRETLTLKLINIIESNLNHRGPAVESNEYGRCKAKIREDSPHKSGN
jgi:glycosyltransferase involved in cell wall biosynthesis